MKMEGTTEGESGALGGLFQQIITDMKNGTPLWEDLIVKANKLQMCLRATIQAIAAYLDAFQKIADAATNTRGATKDIGTALTRICLRHRAVETKMKTFTSAIMDCLIAPLQEKLEDWKKSVMNLDKEHAKDSKKARAELKKRSTDTLRLQKKARKGGKTDDLNKALQQVTEKKELLEETEKNAVRAALIEERSRYCVFVTFLKPVVEEEISMLSELSHLQEVMDQLEKHTSDPYTLPLASEQFLSDLRATDSSWTLHSPPGGSSPSSLGSRKSSMCSISSLTSTSSSSSKSHSSPSHPYWNRSVSQRHHFPALSSTCIGSSRCLGSVSSQDSGFTSQDTLYARNSTASYFKQQVSDMAEEDLTGGKESTIPTSTWPNLQDTLQFEKAATAIINDRPHTISSAYEKGHTRPALSVYTFQSPDSSGKQQDNSPNSESTGDTTPIAYPQASHGTPTTEVNAEEIYSRPPLPQRHSSPEVPLIPDKTILHPPTYKSNQKEEYGQATYANLYDLSNKPPVCGITESHYHSIIDNNNEKNECTEKESSASESSLESSSGYGSQSGMSGATPTPEHDANDTCNVKSAAHYINEHYSTDSRSRLSSISTSGYCTIKSGTLSRRGSIQSQKPPPPVRRSSSILNTRTEHSSGGSLENLPPPPAFLLDCGNSNNVADIRKSITSCIAAEIQQKNSMERNVMFTDSVRKNNVYTSFKDDGDKKVDVERKGISVAETVRTLTEMNHQPASPVSVRRTHSSRSISTDRKQESSGIIAALSARIAPNVNPRHGRKEGKTVTRANRVRQWIALRTVADPTMCHGSLMDQIKRGTLLKPTGVMNDRSAPKTY